MEIASTQQFTLGTISVNELCGASLRRKRLTFTVSTGIAYVIDRPGLPNGSGMPLVAGYPLHLDERDYGDMVKHSWFGSALSGTPIIGVIDVQELD